MYGDEKRAVAREGSDKPLPWPFGSHVARYKIQEIHTLGNCLDKSPATTRTWILQALPSTPSSMTPYSASALREPKVSNTYSWLADYTRIMTTSRNYQRDHTALPPLHSEGSDNIAGLHPDDRGSNTMAVATTGR